MTEITELLLSGYGLRIKRDSRIINAFVVVLFKYGVSKTLHVQKVFTKEFLTTGPIEHPISMTLQDMKQELDRYE